MSASIRIFPALRSCCAGLLILVSAAVSADDNKLEAAIGGGVGGAVGAVVGEELGGRKGAIAGAAAGAAIGAAIATDEDKGAPRERVVIVEDHHAHTHAHPPAHGRHCPPGQAKKGRC